MASDPARKKPGLALSLLYVGLGLAGFVATAKALTPLVPWPDERGMRAKYEAFASRKDEYDAVYIGSSRVFRAVDPQIVDSAVHAAGRPFRSFNFGLDGMMAFESDFVMRELLKLEPAKLEWIVFEANLFDPAYEFPGTDPRSRQAVYWHTPRQTLLALESVWLSKLPLAKRCELAWVHIETAAWKFANYGDGTVIAKRLLGWDGADIAKDVPLEIAYEDEGYQRMEGLTTKFHTEGRVEFLKVLDKYKEYVARIPTENAVGADLSAYNFRALREQKEEVARVGAELVYVNMPNFRGTPDVIALAATGELPHFLQYNDPQKYPEIFEVDRRQDRGHLSRKGAEDFSRHLADALLGLMDGQ